ncbi:uncharacterized protein LOC122388955 isoform X3 [Amphibalanus amphitrite]|uniref:uncharacterized protein LOC122388955 isoform X3 n=1 Tax=Amphibalanus amphitrite TaxID=1232801 RepID=UPI001C91E666|nr:uncharacterized protein LOC122388955 isoform X3 [Amphibalanus amphitrite]
MSVEELKRARVAARGWLKRAVIKIDQAVASGADDVELNSIISEFNLRLGNLDSVQQKLELCLDESELEEDISRASEVRDAALESRLRALRFVDKRSAKSSKPGETDPPLSVASQNVKLPTLQLPKFGGQVLEWEPFWDQFVASVDISDLPEVSKLVYLKSLLYGDARQAIDGLAVVSENYKVACDILKERFARPAQIIFAHVEKLLKLGVHDSKDLKSVQDSLLLHIRSLERLGVGGETYGVILTPLVLSRLPDSFRLEWARGSAGREGDLNFLLDCLKAEIERLERSRVLEGSSVPLDLEQRLPAAQKRNGRRPQPAFQRRPPAPRGPAPAAASVLHSAAVPGDQPAPALQEATRVVSTSSGCGFCRKPHPTDKCPKTSCTSLTSGSADLHG